MTGHSIDADVHRLPAAVTRGVSGAGREGGTLGQELDRRVRAEGELRGAAGVIGTDPAFFANVLPDLDWRATSDLAGLSGAGLAALVLDEVGPLPEAATQLRGARAALAPGGLLIARTSLPKATRTTRTTRTPRDEWATALFATGFDSPRFRESRDELVVSARRSLRQPPAERDATLSVVMPVYNERATFRQVMEQLLDKVIPGVELEVIVVESNSSDGTREEVLGFADHPRVRVVLEDRPQGKGHAVRAGLAAASGDFVLIQDADLEYDLDDYEKLLAPLRALESSFVLGARIRTHGARFGVRHFEKQIVISRVMNVGNVVFLGLFNFVNGVRLEDPFTMYKVIRRDCLFGMRLERDRFDFDWELTAKLLRAGYRPLEIPVWYQSRSFDDGKKISLLKDPLTWITACLRYRFARFED